MNTLTKEEKAAKRQADLEAKALAQAEYKRQEAIEKADYFAALPKRLMDMQALATSIGIVVDVILTEQGPSVHFYNESRKGGMDETLTYTSEEWEVNMVEDTLKQRKKTQDAIAARTILARGIIAKLSTEEKLALKENSWLL